MDYNPKTVLSIECILVDFVHMHEIKEGKEEQMFLRENFTCYQF